MRLHKPLKTPHEDFDDYFMRGKIMRGAIPGREAS